MSHSPTALPDVPPSIYAPTEEQLAKLPKWAQDAFKSLERERYTAVRELQQWTADQTPSPISIMEMVSDGTQRGPKTYTRFVHTTDLKINWQGVELTIALRSDGPMHENCIKLQWSGHDRGSQHIGFIPDSFQSAYLIHPDNMRK